MEDGGQQMRAGKYGRTVGSSPQDLREKLELAVSKRDEEKQEQERAKRDH